MDIKHFFPRSDIIQKHVVCYHFFNAEGKYYDKEILIYPHYLHTVTIFNTYPCEFSEEPPVTNEPQQKKLLLGVIGRFTRPLLCKCKGRIKALSIVFKPMGINFFCDKTFEQIVPNVSNHFPHWTDKADEFEELLYCNDIDRLTEKLDDILLSFYRPFENKIIFDALSLLHSNYADYNVEQIEKASNINRKTLLRQFKKHLGVSITDYRRILRFRDAIKLHEQKETLTKLAYEANFSDQSHFIKEVKKLAGENPKKVFKEAGFVNNTPFFLKIM